MQLAVVEAGEDRGELGTHVPLGHLRRDHERLAVEALFWRPILALFWAPRRRHVGRRKCAILCISKPCFGRRDVLFLNATCWSPTHVLLGDLLS